ncbi:MAG: SRPBCC domain-containing protein [Rubricoccaceae bacterium]|nr:SRPBCC domain-containing protein [Rubricoccaceae bacterium]
MPIYQSTFEINSTAERVWDVLSSLDQYADWNPQIPFARGPVEVGSKMSLRLKLPGRPAMNLSAIIEDAQPGSLLTWRGHVVAPWFFEGYRKFEITPVGERLVRVTHVEDVHGLFAPIFDRLMGAPCRTGQLALNQALRARAESES